MAQARDLSQDLERHRQVLEETVSNLRKLLHVWEQWYIEYSHLKEEVTTLPEQPPSRKELARIRRDFDSELITKKEINEIFGKTDLKKPEQILSVLSRRIDYVEKNVETLEKQLETAENKLAASTVLSDPDGVVDEESGLPITDIIEEIDELGNVVNFRLQTGGDVGPQVLEALKKAGVDAPDERSDARDSAPNPAPEDDSRDQKPETEPGLGADAVNGNSAEAEARDQEPSPDDKPTAKRKSVSFATDTKTGHDVEEQPKSRTAQRLEAIMQQARDLENMSIDSAIVPEDESEEDAQMRREMLDYSASEIGPIVAELELDEGPTDDDDEEFDYTEDEDDDEEDELGRSKHSVITDDYIKRMQELERRLGVESAFATQRSAPRSEVAVEGIGRIKVRHPTSDEAPLSSLAQASAPKPEKPAKKGVRFAEELDIADESATVQPEPPVAKKAPEVNPVNDVVLERTSKPAPSPAESSAKKPSRFKKDRASAVQPAASPLIGGPLNAPVRFLDEDRTVAPSGPEGKTVAEAVLEREVASTPKDPDEMDATLLHQEAAVEYHRMRNRLIQKQGGFAKEDERAIVPLDEEEGGPKKMSRFKAARLSRQ